ncbi:MAG: PQQ-binding-like beta-propeller repeat protein [Planctomycetes bacterium]|nr:PQQ-binding-like beta-propeller repeat protein [Planctomycetota bacterium]
MRKQCVHMERLVTVLAATLAIGMASAWADAGQEAQQIIQATGVKGGVIAHVGCGDGTLTAALRVNDSYVVQGLDTDAAAVAKAREYIRSLGVYGPVSVDSWDGKRLPYIDNFVNLVVVTGEAHPENEEIMRVLAPKGVAYIKKDGQWTKTVKPRPKEMDEWTHYLHDPSNNAVSHDQLVAPLGRYQWIGSPRYSRQHDHMSSVSAAVTANGRVFYIFEESPRAFILTPPEWVLIARDAFNGTLLWKRPIVTWHYYLWPLKSGPQILTRRLVAEGDRVYVTLGIDAPLTALDAATGKTVRTYEGTKATEEILLSNGVLFLSVAAKGQPLRSDPARKYANMKEIRADVTNPLWTDAPRTVMAVNAESGDILWKKKSVIVPMTLTADSKRVLFHDGKKIQCLNRQNGEVLWTSEPLARKEKMRSSQAPTLVIYDDVVLYSGFVATEKYKQRGSTTMFALSAKDGKMLWKAEHPPCGHAGTPKDILVLDGIVWSGAVASGRDSGIMTGRDLHTGEVKSEFPPDVTTYWFHHRCYRAKATDNYLLFSRTGIEFIDVKKKHWICHHWVRGACLYGIMPGNGLMYAPQHPCACYLEAKLYGFTALAPASKKAEPRREIPDEERLARGPAYDQIENRQSKIENVDDWPTYRHDAERSGSTATAVQPTGLGRAWEAKLGGRLSSAVIADGKLFVASVDTHTVHALDAATGKPAWTFTAGGRVDSPPTIWQRRALFGSADGYVYCLRASDGQLVWRFRAAPEDRRMGSFEQVESVWPVHGSVLMQNDALYCVAGRSMFVDGGLHLLRLDPKTGEKLSETILNDRDPETKENLQSHITGLNMPVTLPDILSSDGKYVYMRSLPFDLEGKRKFVTYVNVREQQGDDVHLFSPTGFLDGSEWHRTYWVYGRAFASGAGGYYQAGRVAPSGRLLVLDKDKVYGYGRLWRYYRWTTPLEFELFASAKQPEIVVAGTEKRPIKKKGKRTGKFRKLRVTRFEHDWSDDIPVQVCAMTLAGGTLFVAGPPDVEDEEQSVRSLSDPETEKKLAEQSAALKGKRGALLVAVSPADGKQLAAYKLDSMPIFDGMIAANGRLYLSTSDGKVVCLATGTGQALSPAPDVKATPREPDPVLKDFPGKATAPKINLPSASEDFAALRGAFAWRSDLGYRVCGAESGSGYVLKKLPEPVTGKATFRLKINFVVATKPERPRRNGFFVFGSSVDSKLVLCGVYQKQKKAAIIDGTEKKADRADRRLTIDLAKTQEMVVTVDVPSGQVAMTIGGEQVVLTLKRGLKSISYIGYCVQNAVCDFGPVEVSRE